MNSMTGFGRGSAALGAHSVSVQVNSVNRRGLDLSVSLPDAWEQLESSVSEGRTQACSRGAKSMWW